MHSYNNKTKIDVKHLMEVKIMKMLNSKDFKTFTLDEMRANPNDAYFNTKTPGMKVIGVRVEKKNISRYDFLDILPEIFKQINDTEDMDIRFALTVKELADLVESGKIRTNDNTTMQRNDKTQRFCVISQKSASMLALSIINGDNTMPDIDVVITMENGSLVIYINDGLQRTSTISKFIHNQLEIVGTGTKLDGCKYESLPDDIKKCINNRIINIKVSHPFTMLCRDKTFGTLNTTSTKMSDGEKINAMFGTTKAFDKAIETIRDRFVAEVFCGATKKNQEDIRMDGVSNLLYSMASYFLIEKEYGLGASASKTAVISRFLESPEISSFNEEAEQFFNSVYMAVRDIIKYFGVDFCRKMRTSYTMPNRGNFVSGYEPVLRTNGVNSSFLTTMFYIIMKFADTFNSMNKEQMQEIATLIDKTFADKDFSISYMKSVTGKTVRDRAIYVYNVVKEKLDEMGIDIV